MQNLKKICGRREVGAWRNFREGYLTFSGSICIQDKDLKGNKVKKPILSLIFSNLIVMIVYSPSDCQFDRN
jgi:hypothetical protein